MKLNKIMHSGVTIVFAGLGAWVGFLLVWQFYRTNAAMEGVAGIGEVPTPLFRGIAMLCGLLGGLLWGVTTYLNAQHPQWMRIVLKAGAKSAISLVPAGVLGYSIAMFALTHVPGGTLMTGPAFWVCEWSVYIGTTTAVLVSYIIWRRAIVRLTGSKTVPVKGSFYTVLVAPHEPQMPSRVLGLSLADIPSKAHTLIRAFERQVLAQNDGSIEPRAVLYLDGVYPIALRPDNAPSAGAPVAMDMRSHAFRIRRAGDEFWFVLHVSTTSSTLSWQLDAKARSRNFIGPIIFMGAMGLPFIAWFAGMSGDVTYSLVVGAAIVGALHHIGVWELLFSKERGEKRRTERMEAYLPAFRNALGLALGFPAYIPPTVGSTNTFSPQQSAAILPPASVPPTPPKSRPKRRTAPP